MTIIIYGKLGCSACETAKTLMKRRGIAFQYRDMKDLNDADTAALLANAADAGVRSMPIIVSDGSIRTIQDILK